MTKSLFHSAKQVSSPSEKRSAAGLIGVNHPSEFTPTNIRNRYLIESLLITSRSVCLAGSGRARSICV